MKLACQLARKTILHMKFLKGFDEYTKWKLLQLHENEEMKVNALSYLIKLKTNAPSYMIKYLLCLLVNFQAAIHKNLLLQRCRAFWAYTSHSNLYNQSLSLALHWAGSSPENPPNCYNCTILKSFSRIVNFHSYEVTNIC